MVCADGHFPPRRPQSMESQNVEKGECGVHEPTKPAASPSRAEGRDEVPSVDFAVAVVAAAGAALDEAGPTLTTLPRSPLRKSKMFKPVARHVISDAASRVIADIMGATVTKARATEALRAAKRAQEAAIASLGGAVALVTRTNTTLDAAIALARDAENTFAKVIESAARLG